MNADRHTKRRLVIPTSASSRQRPPGRRFGRRQPRPSWGRRAPLMPRRPRRGSLLRPSRASRVYHIRTWPARQRPRSTPTHARTQALASTNRAVHRVSATVAQSDRDRQSVPRGQGRRVSVNCAGTLDAVVARLGAVA